IRTQPGDPPLLTIRSQVGIDNCLRRTHATCLVLLASTFQPAKHAANVLVEAFRPFAARHTRITLAIADENKVSLRSRDRLRALAAGVLRASNGNAEPAEQGDMLLLLRRLSAA